MTGSDAALSFAAGAYTLAVGDHSDIQTSGMVRLTKRSSASASCLHQLHNLYTAAVPEPASVVLVLLAVGGAIMIRRRAV